MRALHVAVVFAVLLTVPGCGSQDEEPSSSGAIDQFEFQQPQEPEARPAPRQRVKKEPLGYGPVEYIDTVLSIGARQRYRIKKLQVEDAVKNYHALEQAWPSSVEDLVKGRWLPAAPSLDEGDRWVINPETGEVSIVRRKPKR